MLPTTGRSQRYRREGLRSSYWVEKVTKKYVTLKPELPIVKKAEKVLVDEWPMHEGREWIKVG
jgi:hypothetical protein